MQIQQLKVLVPNIFQNEALRILENTKKDRGVIVMPTGTGKTFLASLWFKKQLESNSKAKLLFICHNKDILSQANEKEFQVCLKELDVTYGYYNGEEKNIQQATFGTVQTLVRNLDKFDKELFDYIIVDEAHHYQARTFKKVIEHFKPKFILGLTATPNRKDNKSIFQLLGDKLYEVKVSEAIKKNLLTKINYWCVDNDIDFSNIKWNGSNYDEKDLNRKICVKEYDDAILKEYNETLREKFGKKKTICFCATVEHTYRMAKLFNDNGIKAVGLTGKYFKKDYRVTIHENQRDKIIEGFKNGDYDIIFVRDLFNEGVDIPDCDSIMMLRPTESHTIFTQQLGRGLRVSEGKDNVLILDFTGNAKRCIINFEVLGEMIDLDIVKEIKAEVKDREENGIRFLSNGCEVRLSKRKYNLFKRNKENYKENLVEIFRRLKSKFGRIPTKKEMLIEYGESKRDFTYVRFLTMLGEDTTNCFHKDYTKDELIEYYKKRKMELGGRIPKTTELKKPNSEVYYKLYGSWDNFLKLMGEKNPYWHRYNKRELIRQYKECKKKLGRPPKANEMSENGYAGYDTYKKIFGLRWDEFRRMLGDICIKNNNKKEDDGFRNEKKIMIIKEFKDFYNKNGFYPSIRDIRKNNKVNNKLVSDNTIRRLWGSYASFIREIGGKVRRFSKLDISKEKIIEDYYSLKESLKRVPFGEEIDGRINGKVNRDKRLLEYSFLSAIRQYWGLSYGDFLKKVIGLRDYKEWNKNNRALDENRCKKLREMKPAQKYSKERVEKEYLKVYNKLGRHPNINEIHYRKFKTLPSQWGFKKHLGLKNQSIKEINKYFEHLTNSQNIKITSSYIPKTIIIPVKQKRKGLHKEYKGMNKIEYKSKEDKVNIREKIISKINDGDLVLLLESPELSALKEIEKQNKKPSKIIIPNNFEFNKIAEALKNYKTNLNIELINTSALQYLVDSEEKFDFIWLDYCGAFSFYMKDLDILFQKHLSNMRLILTYNLFDPAKEDDSYYFTRVIDYVLSKTEDKKVRLLNDITYRYKKNMYNIGFNIQEVIK